MDKWMDKGLSSRNKKDYNWLDEWIDGGLSSRNKKNYKQMDSASQPETERISNGWMNGWTEASHPKYKDNKWMDERMDRGLSP